MKYFKEIKQRMSKIADLYLDRDGLVVPINIATEIIKDVERSYEEEVWKSKRNLPFNCYGEASRLVIVRTKNSFEDPKICTYNYADHKFVINTKDITDSVKEWCDVPGYGYR